MINDPVVQAVMVRAVPAEQKGPRRIPARRVPIAWRDAREHALRGLCYNRIAMPPRIFRFAHFRSGCGTLCSRDPGPRCPSAQSAKDAQLASAEARSETILIFPFENESRMASLDWLGEGLSELTAERLEDRDVNVLSRQDRLATLEKMGLPDSARFSHATIIKIAGEADADAVVYGRFQSDGKTVTLEARVLHLSPPSLSLPLTETSSMQDLLRAHARLTWQILCAIDPRQCPAQGANTGRIELLRAAAVAAS